LKTKFVVPRQYVGKFMTWHREMSKWASLHQSWNLYLTTLMSLTKFVSWLEELKKLKENQTLHWCPLKPFQLWEGPSLNLNREESATSVQGLLSFVWLLF